MLGGFPNNGNGGVATYDAVISAVGPAYTVTLSTNITVEALTLNSANATVNQTAGTFTANAGVALSAGTYQLNGGTISNTTINVSGTGSLVIGANINNLLTGVTVNGDLNMTALNAVTRIGPGTSFTTAHLANQSTEIGFLTGATMNGTILLEGVWVNARFIGMSTAGALTIGATGVIRSNTGLGGNAQIGIGNNFTAAMALANEGLISSQVSGRTLTINAATSFANSGNLEALNGGILTITTAGWTNTGTIAVGPGSVVNLGPLNATGGIGTFNNTGGTVNITRHAQQHGQHDAAQQHDRLLDDGRRHDQRRHGGFRRWHEPGHRHQHQQPAHGRDGQWRLEPERDQRSDARSAGDDHYDHAPGRIRAPRSAF